MSLIHIVLLGFGADAKPEDVLAGCDRFRALKEQCKHPKTGQPYIVSIKSGKDNSPEGRQNGLTHGFVVEFSSAEDRDYYVHNDPAHKQFSASLAGLITGVTVVDFTENVF